MPGHPGYWQTTIGMIGKIYSTTMMTVFNSRITFRIQDQAIKDLLPPSSPLVFCAPHGSVLVPREQWTVPVDNCEIAVSIRCPSFP